MDTQNSSKKGLVFVIAIVVVIVAVAVWWWMSNNQAVPLENLTAVEESQFTEEAIGEELENIDTGDLEQEFQDIDADLNNL